MPLVRTSRADRLVLLFGPRLFETFLGFVEVGIGLLIALRLAGPIFPHRWPLSAGASLHPQLHDLDTGRRGADWASGDHGRAGSVFLLKDVGLLAASFWVFADSLEAVLRR